MLASRGCPNIQQRCHGGEQRALSQLLGQQYSRPLHQPRQLHPWTKQQLQLNAQGLADKCESRRAVQAAAAAAAGQSPATPYPGKSELQQLLQSIPYKRLLLWSAVGAVAWQLHEFFGVGCESTVAASAFWQCTLGIQPRGQQVKQATSRTKLQAATQYCIAHNQC
jgi:hypothetical protein